MSRERRHRCSAADGSRALADEARPLPVEVGPADLQREVHEPLDVIAAATGRPVTVAAWRRGTRFDPDTLADRVLRERGIRHVISNWSIETVRTG